MSKEDTPKKGAVARFRVKGTKCPICKNPAVLESRPFCSKRCGQIDLGRWLGEVYRAPVDEDGWSESEAWSGDAQSDQER
jgi:endogenous inhibitor of DNA gyrase (YacG/DUF329 family)